MSFSGHLNAGLPSSVSVCGCQFREATAWQLAIGRASLAPSRETISFQMLYFLYSLIAGLYMSGWEQVCMNGRVVGLIVLAGVDLSPPDGAAMQMSTCPLCSLLAPARDGVPNFCSNWGFTMEAVLSKDHYQNTHYFCTFHTPQHGTIPHWHTK